MQVTVPLDILVMILQIYVLMNAQLYRIYLEILLQKNVFLFVSMVTMLIIQLEHVLLIVMRQLYYIKITQQKHVLIYVHNYLTFMLMIFK